MKQKLINFLTLYLPKTPFVFVYMLQQVEYDPGQFITWANRLPNYRRVIRRKKLVLTRKAQGLLVVAYTLSAAWLTFVILLVIYDWHLPAIVLFAWGPLLLILALAGLTKLATVLVRLKRRKDLGLAAEKMAAHPGAKIAILGSYGKTTAKELLATVLSEGKKVAYTPGNMNVDISHARWIMNKVTGDEDVVIFEFGEAHPGDIGRFARLVKPDIAIITGLAPNHLETYGSLASLKEDLASIENYVESGKLYIHEQAAEDLPLEAGNYKTFGPKKVAGWDLHNVSSDFAGTKLTLQKGSTKLKLHSQLLGSHLAPVIGLVAILAKEIGLTDKQIQAGVELTKPYEHRLQPVPVSGAWIIDDTYNGNIEGMRAGLALLADLPAKRKIFVTPGLVEQGDQTETVHRELGELIARAKPDEVVLMQNSVTHYIKEELLKHGFKGVVRVEADPLHFYTNLPYELAAGDVVLMQNDWTDNYA